MKLLSKVKERLKHQAREGQAVVETALVIPILLILIAGIVEIGAMSNEYMTVHDAAREGGRFGANLDPELTSQYFFDTRDRCNPFPDVRPLSAEELRQLCDLGRTTNFWYEVACLTFQNIPLDWLDQTEADDIVVTVIGVRNGQIVSRWPISSTHRYPGIPGGDPECGTIPPDQAYHFRGVDDGEANSTCTAATPENCRAWSLYGLRDSQFYNAAINSDLLAAAPNTAFVIIEVFHAVPHFTGLFNIGDYIPNPVPTRPYAIFPVSAAEPRD